LELFSTQMELFSAPVELYFTPVELFSAPMELFSTPMELFSTQMELFFARMESFSAQVELFSTQVEIDFAPVEKQRFTVKTYFGQGKTISKSTFFKFIFTGLNMMKIDCVLTNSKAKYFLTENGSGRLIINWYQTNPHDIIVLLHHYILITSFIFLTFATYSPKTTCNGL
jgi:hypothetical protein